MKEAEFPRKGWYWIILSVWVPIAFVWLAVFPLGDLLAGLFMLSPLGAILSSLAISGVTRAERFRHQPQIIAVAWLGLIFWVVFLIGFGLTIERFHI